MRHDRAHRIGAPSVVYYDGDIYYIEYGDFHNMKGPSNISSSGRYFGYYVRGKFYTKNEFEIRNKTLQK